MFRTVFLISLLVTYAIAFTSRPNAFIKSAELSDYIKGKLGYEPLTPSVKDVEITPKEIKDCNTTWTNGCYNLLEVSLYVGRFDLL